MKPPRTGVRAWWWGGNVLKLSFVFTVIFICTIKSHKKFCIGSVSVAEELGLKTAERGNRMAVG